MQNKATRGVIILHKEDNVATTIFDLAPESRIKLHGDVTLTVRDSIQAGHKLSLRDLPANSRIIKYGEVIGISTKPILAGQHVHIHNVQSLRGRADP